MKKIISTFLINILFINLFLSGLSQEIFAVNTDGTASNWTIEKARHLASKVLFAPTKEIVDQLFQAGSADSAVDILFPSEEGPNRDEYNNLLFGTGVLKTDYYNNGGRNKMNKYYLYKKYLDPYEAKAKAFLIFEDIFSVDELGEGRILFSDIERTHNVIYNDMFGTGGYKKIIKDVLFGSDGSYSLSEYLDLLDSNRKYPNENYARELMQLFLMGIFKPYDNQNTPNLVRNYSEEDVASIAKILTGLYADEDHNVYYDFEPDSNNYRHGHNRYGNGDLDGDGKDGDVYFLDGDLKSGDSFDFYNSGSGTINLLKIEDEIGGNNGLADNIIDYIFSKREHEIALFLADKFFRFYAHMNPSKNDLEELAKIFTDNNFQIFPTLKTFLKSDVIYSNDSMNSIHFKSPIELGIGTLKLIHKNHEFGDISSGSFGSYFLKDLGREPYEPTTIFGRDGYDDNSEFYNAYFHDKWMTYSTKILSSSNTNFDLNDFLKNERINETGSLIFGTGTGNNFTGNIVFDEIGLNLNGDINLADGAEESGVCSGGLVFGSGSVNFPDFNISTNSGGLIKIFSGSVKTSSGELKIFYGSLNFSGAICNISSGTGNISGTGEIFRDFTIEEFFSDFEENFYVGRKIPDLVKNKLKNFLTTNSDGEKILFDVTNSNFRENKIIPAIGILLAQPEFLLVSGYDKNQETEDTGSSVFNGKDEKLVIIKLGGGYDWLNGIIPKAEYNSTYQDFRKKVNSDGDIVADIRIGTGDLLDLNDDFYINKNLSSFRDLYNSGDLKIFNRIGISNHSRGHNVASVQMTSSDGDAVYQESEGVIGNFSKNEDPLSNIAIRTTPYVYRGGKSIEIGGSGLKVGVSKGDLNDVVSGFTGVILSRNYPGNLENIFKGSLSLNNIGTIAKNSELNRDGAGYSFSDNMDFIKISIENGVGSTFYLRGPGGYDTHRNQLKIDDNHPEGYLNTNLKILSEKLKDFYKSIKDNNDVTVIVESEFGRTLKVNGSKGTDHGKGGGYFIISNNFNLKKSLNKKIYGKMNLAKEKENYFGIGIDYRAVYSKILNGLYGISENIFGKIYDINNYMDENPPKVNLLRPEFTAYNSHSAGLKLKFSVDDKNFKLYDGSDVRLYYGTNLDNLKEYRHSSIDNYVRKSQWDSPTTYVDGDGFTLDFNLGMITANYTGKYFYKIVAMDNQFDELSFTGSFLIPKIIYDNDVNRFNTDKSSILKKYNNTTITGSTLIGTGIILTEAGTGEILFGTGSDNIQMKAFSGTTKITSLTFTGSENSGIWNGSLILPSEIDKEFFIPSDAELNGEKLSNLNIKKVIKIGASEIGIGMNLDKKVEISINGFLDDKNYGIISSEDGQNWKTLYSDINVNSSGSLSFNTNHFSYFAVIELADSELGFGENEEISSIGDNVSFTGSLVGNSGEKVKINLKQVFEKFGENNLNKVKKFKAEGNFLKFLNKKIKNSSGEDLVGIKIGTGTKIFSPKNFFENFKKEKISSISNKNIEIGGVKKIRKFKNPIKIGGDKTLILDNYATLTFNNVGTKNSKFGFRKGTGDENDEWTFKDILNTPCEPVFPNECAYQDGNNVVLKTFHFTEFVVVEDEDILDNCPNGDYTNSNSDGSCGSAPVVSSGGGGGGGGGGGSFGPTVGNFTISASSKKDIETFDNLDFKKIDDGIVPVNIKMKDLSGKYFSEIFKGTKIFNKEGKIFTGKILAPKRISNTKLPLHDGKKVALRALEFKIDNGENITFSKPVKISLSTKGLSKKIKRDEIFIYYFNEEKKEYILENKNRLVDELGEKISVDVNHFTKFILTNGKLSGANFSRETLETRIPFKDIDGHWAEYYIQKLYEKGALAKKEKYYPEINLKRVELLKISMEMFGHGKSENLSVLDKFSDVNKNDWYSPYLAKALELGIVSGDAGKDTFRPGDSITRAEALKVILKSANISVGRENGEFTDVPKGVWFTPYINFAAKNKIVSGYGDGRFGPGDSLNRAGVAKIVIKVLELKDKYYK